MVMNIEFCNLSSSNCQFLAFTSSDTPLSNEEQSHDLLILMFAVSCKKKKKKNEVNSPPFRPFYINIPFLVVKGHWQFINDFIANETIRGNSWVKFFGIL